MFLIRDAEGKVYNKVENPAVVFDKSSGVVIKIGEYDEMKNYLLIYQQALRNQNFEGHLKEVAEDMISNTVLIELIKVQREVDKAFQITGYVGKKYRHVLNYI